jgi:magnesium transporter
MKSTYYQVTEDGGAKEVSGEALLDGWKQRRGLYVVQIRGPEPDALEQLLRSLGVSEPAMQLCLQPRKVSAVIPLDDEIYLEFPVFPWRSEIGTKENETLIISIDHDSVIDTEGFVEILASRLKLARTSVAALLSLFLGRESLHASRRVGALRASVFELDEKMDRNADSVDAEEIRDKKRKLRAYDRVVNGQTTCLEQLTVLQVPFLNFTQRSSYLQLATVNTLAASQAIARLDKTISDLSQRFDMNQQEKTNHRLAILTILSAIFMPLTLIAGIYGMNFEVMPELGFWWAYPAVMLLMVLIAIGMYRFFKTRGWLD